MTLSTRPFSFLHHLHALALLAILAAPAAAQPPADETLPLPPAMTVTAGEPAKLTVWNRPITTFRAALGPTSPAERARAAARRIDDIPGFQLNDLVRVDSHSLARQRTRHALVPGTQEPPQG